MKVNVELRTYEGAKGRQVQLVFVDKGRARYALDVHVQGKEWDARKCRVRFGVRNATVVNARIAAEVERAEVLALEHPEATPAMLRDMMRRPPADGDFTELAARMLKDGPQKGYHTMKMRRNTLEQFAAWAGRVEMDRMAPALMRDYKKYLIARGASANTAAVQLKRLRTMYRAVCKELGRAPLNILDGCDAVERYAETPSRLTVDEVQRLMAYADRQKGWRAKAVHIWLFSFLCAGIRWGDLCRLRTVNIQEGRVRFVQHKTGQAKDVPLQPYAAKVATLYQQGEYVFGINGKRAPSEKKMEAANALANKYLKRAARECGIEKRLHTHNARHSFADLAMDASLDDRAIQTALGISDQVYKHYRGRIRPERVDEQLHDALKAFDL